MEQNEHDQALDLAVYTHDLLEWVVRRVREMLWLVLGAMLVAMLIIGLATGDFPGRWLIGAFAVGVAAIYLQMMLWRLPPLPYRVHRPRGRSHYE